MVRSLLCVCLVIPLLGAPVGPAEAAGGAKKALAQVKGKVYLTNDLLKDKSLQALAEKFADKLPALALERASDDTWSATMVAFLGRKPARGPLTLWFYDKDNMTRPLVTKSLDRRKIKQVKQHLVYDMLLDGELGFKRCRTYVLQVGQILNGKNKAYATGEVLTDPAAPACKAKKKPPQPAPKK